MGFVYLANEKCTLLSFIAHFLSVSAAAAAVVALT